MSYRICPSCGASDGQGCYSTCPTMLQARIAELEAALDLYREAVRIDATMEGPKFMGSNASALKRAWDADRAAITQENTND